MSDQRDELAIFKEDTKQIGSFTAQLVENFYPSYSVNNDIAVKSSQEDSYVLLNGFAFYRLCECTVDNVDDKFAYFSEKIKKLFTTIYAIRQEVCYGIVSYEGKTSIVLGVAPSSDDSRFRCIIEGLLPGVKIEKYEDGFQNSIYKENEKNAGKDRDRFVGCISGIPALKVDGEYQQKDLSSIMRSLNGQNYTIMVLCRPVDFMEIQKKIDEAIKIKDECFAISKRTVSLQEGRSSGNTHSNMRNTTDGQQISKTTGGNLSGALPLAAAGAAIGSVIPGAGTVVGAIGGGIIGLVVGKQLSFNIGKTKTTSQSITTGYSDAVTESISQNKSISAEMQNSFAIELMTMSEKMIERLKIGRNIGMWQTVVTFSAEDKTAHDIIKGSLYSEMASGLPDVLPPVIFEYEDKYSIKRNSRERLQQLMIPEGFFGGSVQSPLCSYVTSEELSGICTIPVDNTVGFKIREAKGYSLNYHQNSADKSIGNVCEFERPLDNVCFGLSEEDLNKHTFVCGITGYGKTNTVKKILQSIDKPFMVIEPVKTEYRNIQKDELCIYTIGRPELNCIRLNPFYIMPGVSPQQHIDALKDLFSASFGLYGPMPFIVEKCLYSIYKKKGWNLTLGFHPCLVKDGNKRYTYYEQSNMECMYGQSAHKYMFPTMQDLREEVARYIDTELTYEGEVKGNIKAAIKARIDSLCVGTKGYIFNTHEMVDFNDLLKKNTVLELEGLADDSDKAFALGLLIIYVNEYRQVKREIDSQKGLKHILVIEEAHRLLENVSTENNEYNGNPKGKAVEHFTNMLAEMRSYGQGIIVAEQIPTKIAPEVIKNSSNKIVHRLVSRDDQETMASAIGISAEEAIHIGNSKTGYALCHKEGMIKPVIVKIDKVESENILDKSLYDKDLDEKLFAINKSIIETEMPDEISMWATKVLVSILHKDSSDILYDGIERAYDATVHKADLAQVSFVPIKDMYDCFRQVISEQIVELLSTSVFSNKKMVDNNLKDMIEKTVKAPDDEKVSELYGGFTDFYAQSPSKKAIEQVGALLSENYSYGYDIVEKAMDYSLRRDKSFGMEVKHFLDGRR